MNTITELEATLRGARLNIRGFEHISITYGAMGYGVSIHAATSQHDFTHTGAPSICSGFSQQSFTEALELAIDAVPIGWRHAA